MKWVLYLITGLIVAMFYFPFEFTFFPGANTKMIMAGLGLPVILLIMARKREFTFPRTIFFLLLLSGLVSLISLFSITFNQTPDKAYVSYVVSAAVWLSAAFVLCHIIFLVHGTINVNIVLNYLTCVCLGECILAMAINYNESVQVFVDKIVYGLAYIRNLERLYAPGCALDMAGTRFSCVLIGISFLVSRQTDKISTAWMYFLFFAFAAITVLGNMIARTTVVGSVIGLAYMLVFGVIAPSNSKGKNGSKLFRVIVIGLAIAIPIVIYYNRINDEFRELMEFGFEGFYSLAEKGEWEVSSNEILKDMIVWPDNLKTWIIGDGYFLNQRYDANYIGDATTAGYYMGTDIGYLRFIFYFGIVGLMSIMAVITYAAIICMNEYKEHAFMFFMILVAGYIMWLKSSTDIFVFFCPFICAAIVRQEYISFGYLDDEDDEQEEQPDTVLTET